MQTYTVKFLTPGQMVIYKERRFRTPVTFEGVLKKDLSFFDSQSRRSLIKYEVFETPEQQREEPIKKLILEKEDEDIEIEELTEINEPSTILEKLIASNKRE